MMNFKKYLKTSFLLLILAANIGCDQITKESARNQLNYGETVSVIPHYVSLIKVENTGAFLSLGDSWPYLLKMGVLWILPALTMVALLLYMLLKKQIGNRLAIGLAFIVGGGIGNLYDRMLYGSVTDFLHLDFQIFETGIFNMADVSIMFGSLLVLISSYHKKPKAPELDKLH